MLASKSKINTIMESNRVLFAEERHQAGKSNARLLRKQGKIPAIMYGHSKKPLSILVDQNKVNQYYTQPSFTAKVIEIKIGKNSHRVIPHQIQLHHTKDTPIHLDFLFLGDKRQTVNVPVIYSNRMSALGVKRGGVFNIIKRKVFLDCPIDLIPQNIEIDVEKLGINKSIKAKDLRLPEDVKLALADDTIIACISGRGKSDKDTEEEAENKENLDEKK